MRIIVVDEQGYKPPKTLRLDKRLLWLCPVLLAVIAIALLSQSYLLQQRAQLIEKTQVQLAEVQQSLLLEQRELQAFYQYSNGVFQQQAKQAGLLQARMTRLEALGSRLADRADFADEFDFYNPPSVGGPEADIFDAEPLSQADIRSAFKHLNVQLDRREQEIQAIDALLSNKKLRQETYIAGRPAESGWLSSNFGKRIDPFTGSAAWHNGVDFAGKEGTHVLAVAAGVVVWSGNRYGYGQLVEVNHGNGFTTRYAHNKENTVRIGDVVSKGQTLAKMGSTGRSTGPHVHFEVLHNGKAVDPRNYIYRKSL